METEQEKRKKINRRFTPINADERRAAKQRELLSFCLSGDGDKQKLSYCGLKISKAHGAKRQEQLRRILGKDASRKGALR